MANSIEMQSYLTQLVILATQAGDRSSLRALLERVANDFHANGAIIWRETPFTDIQSHESKGGLFVFAEWSQAPHRCQIDDLPLQSATGRAILDGRPELIVDVEDPEVYKRDGYIKEANIQTISIHPLTFGDLRKGSLNFYFQSKLAVSRRQLAQLTAVAKLFPSLVQIVEKNAAHNLVLAVDRILDQGFSERAPDISETLRQVCSTVAEQRGALEVSLFLRAPGKETDPFSLVATTWPRQFPKEATSYRADKSLGLTAWVLAERKPINIFDLAKFRQQQEQFDQLYKGAVWRDSLNIQNNVKKVLGAGGVNIPPLTFIAVPVELGSLLLGALRCCIATKSPYFFGEAESEMLQLVARQVAQAWVSWDSRRVIYDELKLWQTFVDKIGELNGAAEEELKKYKPDLALISEHCLRVASSVITKELVADTRIYDQRAETLSFQAIYGKDWSNGPSEEQMRRKTRVFPTAEEKPTSVGAHVIQTKMPVVLRDIENEPLPYYSPTFPDCKWLVCFPIISDDQAVGVLDLRGTGGTPFPPHTEPIAALLAKQLGLYTYLTTTVSRLKQQPMAFAQSFEDFNHQLRSPILHLHRRIKRTLEPALYITGINEELRREIKAVRGLAGKCRAISESLRLFATLAQEKAIPLNKRYLDKHGFNRLVNELISDAQDLSEPARHLSFRFEPNPTPNFVWGKLQIDRDLLLQALLNLIDNAEKYSFDSTTVVVSSGLAKSGRFRISVASTGIKLVGDDIHNCKKRTWRSVEAESVTGDGSGLGLWIVDNIMAAHEGDLTIHGTNAEWQTTVELLFPLDK